MSRAIVVTISGHMSIGEAVQRYLDGDRDLALRRSLALDPTLPGAAELVSRLMIKRPT